MSVNVERINKLNEQVNVFFRNKHLIVLEPTAERNEELDENIVYDAGEWKIPEKFSKYISEFFLKFFNDSNISVIHQKTKSGVSDQPFDEETYKGAQNRVNNLMKDIKEEADFYISCEAGIESFMGNYFNVQVVCIFDRKTQNYLWGKSAGWQIPSEDIQIIRKNNLDDYLRNKGISRINQLLGDENSRKLAVMQATELALCSAKLL